MLPRMLASVLLLGIVMTASLGAQSSSSERVRVAPAPFQNLPPADSTTSLAQLEKTADELQSSKQFIDAADYYKAAIAKARSNAVLYDKRGVCELLSERFGSAKSDFERATKLDRRYAPAYNNLGVLDYARRSYRRAIKQYKKAISLEPDSATYYSNLGAVYFAKKKWEKATEVYNRAVTLDPNIFERSSKSGVAGQVASPEDRARFAFVLAKLYARHGLTDRSLECLRRAMEEGYKGVNEVYSDADFSALRKDPRFSQLMSSRPFSIPE
jgi:tetratricopeptide (TPR) repeat protein